jgi:hypothetical protein
MKKFYTLLTALAATAAMNAAETQNLTCWLSICDDDDNWTYASSTITVKAQIDGNDVVFVDWLDSSQNPNLDNPQRDLHFNVSDDYVVTCGVKASEFASESTGWKKNLWQLSEYGSFTHMYLVSGDASENTYCSYYYEPDTKYFRIYTWFENRDSSGDTVEDSDDFYCLTIKMPDDFLAAVAQKNDATGYLVEDDDWSEDSFTFTQTYTVNGGVVTLTNFLGSSQNVEITAYDNGSAKQTGGLDGYVIDTYTFGDLTFARVYFDKGSYFYCEYDEENNRLWIEGYGYESETDYTFQEFGFYLALPDGFTPEEAPVAEAAAGTTTVVVNGTEYTTSVTYKDGVLTLPNFLNSGQEVSFTITEDSDGIKSVTANFDASYISIDTDAYVNFYQYGTSYPEYITYVQGDDGQDYIKWGGYLYDSSNAYIWATDAIKIYIPSEAALLRGELIGEYTGNAGGWDYSGENNGGVWFTTEYDGTENAYVKIEQGENENEVKISNLIPTGTETLHATEVLTGVVAAYTETSGYKATITIEPVDDGYIDYVYSGTNYPTNTRIAAGWNSSAYESAPTAPVVLYVTEDGDIELNWTGIYLWMDWKGDQTTWYGGYMLGFNNDTLTKVTEDAGVKTVTVAEDNTDAPVQYFNLNGIRVNGDNLTPGLYIRRQGTKASKVIIR